MKEEKNFCATAVLYKSFIFYNSRKIKCTYTEDFEVLPLNIDFEDSSKIVLLFPESAMDIKYNFKDVNKTGILCSITDKEATVNKILNRTEFTYTFEFERAVIINKLYEEKTSSCSSYKCEYSLKKEITDGCDETVKNELVLKALKLARKYTELYPKMKIDINYENPDLTELAYALTYLVGNETLFIDILNKNTGYEKLSLAYDFAEPGFKNEYLVIGRRIKSADKFKYDRIYDELEKEMENKLKEKSKEKSTEGISNYVIKHSLDLLDYVSGKNGSSDFAEKIKHLDIDKAYKPRLYDECKKLKKYSRDSYETPKIINYLNLVTSIKWNNCTQDNMNIDYAREILEKEHYGLSNVKELILEILAVRYIKKDIKGQAICLVGPPGVGKTSIAKSIAKAMGRKFVRVPLGGVDRIEQIVGDSIYYIGSTCGNIISAIKKTGVSNPVILLDEIDKLGESKPGSAYVALLSVLDPSQNDNFVDTYLQIPYDLSNVLFIATANCLDDIPATLRDRMEIIMLDGYTQEEKFHIAKEYIIPKVIEENGIKNDLVSFTDEAIEEIINGYITDAGVRKIVSIVERICRKCIRQFLEDEKKIIINPEMIEELIGPQLCREKIDLDKDEVGIAKGLSVAATGCEISSVEAITFEGTGKIKFTGSLNNVFKECSKAAMSCIRLMADKYSIDKDFYKNKDIHIHCHNGAYLINSTDEGIAVTAALFSAIKNIPVRADTVMTGEVSLRGRILPAHSSIDKIIKYAYSKGIKNIIIPKQNKGELINLDENIKNDINVKTVESIDEVIDFLFYSKAEDSEKSN